MWVSVIWLLVALCVTLCATTVNSNKPYFPEAGPVLQGIDVVAYHGLKVSETFTTHYRSLQTYAHVE